MFAPGRFFFRGMSGNYSFDARRTIGIFYIIDTKLRVASATPNLKPTNTRILEKLQAKMTIQFKLEIFASLSQCRRIRIQQRG
jgi:hypothetical protein